MLCCLPWSTWATFEVIASNSAAKRVFPAPLGLDGRPGACEGADVTGQRVDVFIAVPYGTLRCAPLARWGAEAYPELCSLGDRAARYVRPRCPAIRSSAVRPDRSTWRSTSVTIGSPRASSTTSARCSCGTGLPRRPATLAGAATAGSAGGRGAAGGFRHAAGVRGHVRRPDRQGDSERCRRCTSRSCADFAMRDRIHELTRLPTVLASSSRRG